MSDSKAEKTLATRLGGAIQSGIWAVAVLLLLAALGIGITDFSTRYGSWYWTLMVPVFGLTSLLSGMARAQDEGRSVTAELRRQLLHWGATFVVVQIVFLLEAQGRFNNADTGLAALMALALATFLAGVHGDWRFMLVGILLAVATAGAAFVEQFLWLGLIPIVGAVGVVIYWLRRSRKAIGDEARSLEQKLTPDRTERVSEAAQSGLAAGSQGSDGHRGSV